MTHWLTDLLTTWKHEMLAHLKIYISQNAFRSKDPQTGPNHIFAFKTQQQWLGKWITWENSGQSVQRSFWVSRQKCDIHFGPDKRPKRLVSGHMALKFRFFWHQKIFSSSFRSRDSTRFSTKIHRAGSKKLQSRCNSLLQSQFDILGAPTVYGIWCMVYGIWYMVYGLWYMVYGICGQ